MPSKPQTRGSTLWRHPAFMRLWAAQSLSAFGNRITRTALPIIAITTLAVSPAEAALLSALGFAPVVVAGLAGGGLVERARKVRLMVAMDLLRFTLVMAIPIAFALGVRSFWLLVLVSMAVSAASALFQNADTSILPRLVGKSQLVDANSKLQTTESIAELAGPGVAGVLVDLLTAPVAIIVDAVTFLWSAVWLGSMRSHSGEADAPGEPVAHGQSALRSLREDVVVGFRAVMRHPALRALLYATVAFYGSAGFFFGLYMLFALRTLGLSASLVGVIISMGGFSGLGGALLSASHFALAWLRSGHHCHVRDWHGGQRLAAARRDLAAGRRATALRPATAQRRRVHGAHDPRLQPASGASAAERDRARQWPLPGDRRHRPDGDDPHIGRHRRGRGRFQRRDDRCGLRSPGVDPADLARADAHEGRAPGRE